jgi:hypothetical protein
MNRRLATLLITSLVSMAGEARFGVHAQTTHGDKALGYLQGQWYNGDGRLIEFFVTRDVAKFSDTRGPGSYTGGYRAGEAGADYVLEYPFGLKCFYNVRFGVGDQKEIVFDLLGAVPEKDREICVRGAFRRQTDRR